VDGAVPDFISHPATPINADTINNAIGFLIARSPSHSGDVAGIDGAKKPPARRRMTYAAATMDFQ
jgi:hypothetical protein